MSMRDELVTQAENALHNGLDHAHDSSANFLRKMDFQALETELKKVKSQLDAVGDQIQRGAAGVNHNVHANPYAYVAGAFGTGFLAAMWLKRSRK